MKKDLTPSEREAQIEVVRYIREQTDLLSFLAAREEVQTKGPALELVALDDRPRIRPSEPLLVKQRVYI